MNSLPGWMSTLAVAMAGAAAGALLCAWLTSRSARKRKTIPKRWPLSARVLANTEERKVWRWLTQSFSDHYIMIKIPVTRFTLPRSQEQGLHWYELLSGVYCTFTVCRSDGRVVGCVDVLGPQGLSRSNRQLKQSLLSQCGIAYWVLEPDGLPSTGDIRTEFLGNEAAEAKTTEREHDEAQVNAARTNLSAALERQRRSRAVTPPSTRARRTPNSPPESHRALDSSQDSSSGYSSGWQHDNSFLAPLDSRRSALN
ncbi:MAG: DUF2726 domain-containing protein [Polaromonas sp.]|nr:DUF2726 domain-containing protein [Polaromonas sp.]